MKKGFANVLYDWHSGIERDLPWKDTNDPFFIWLSEIILQQTRVEQGKPYYNKFKARFSNITELATVSDEELMKLWQGLGYYSRARNLHKAAKKIVEEGGQFPRTYEGLLALPGVGPYTAAAIGSFAFNLPTPVIDGNVNRVMARIFGITEGIDTKEGKHLIQERLHHVFDKDHPAVFNQAIMDFGALHCSPKKPKCAYCPFQSSCIAFANDMVSELPIKVKKIKKKNRTIRYAIIYSNEHLVIKKRLEQDIWKHLHDFIEIEDKSTLISDDVQYTTSEIIRVDGPYKHVLTHRNLEIFFHIIEVQDLKIKNGGPYFLVERKNLRKFAYPKIIDWYLTEKSIY